MKLLVFEYSCINYTENLFTEGYTMLDSILANLNESSLFDVYYLVNPSINDLNYARCTRITLNEDLFKWLENNCDNFDWCLFIAPEDDLIQYHITRFLENRGMKLINADSFSSYICSSKTLTYNNLPDTIPKISSKKIPIEKLCQKLCDEKYNYKHGMILKPDDKTSTELVYHVEKKEKIEEIKKEYTDRQIRHVLIQEYIPGENVSVSLIANTEECQYLSLNQQVMCEECGKLKYAGCISPIKHPLEEEIKKLSYNIMESFPGLKGFVGIDYVIHEDKIYFIEINSRLTTPFIVLSKICNKNLTEQLINYVTKNEEIEIEFHKEESFFIGDGLKK